MSLAQSKIYRALGGDLTLVHQVCEQLAAERPAKEIMAWVASSARDKTALPLSDQNISDFRGGYFARWKRARQVSESIRERAAVARQLASEAAAGGASLTEAAQLQASNMLTEALESFDVAHLREVLARNPAQFLQVVNTLGSIARSEHDRRALGLQTSKLEADLRLANERAATLQQQRETAKHQLKERLSALEKAIRVNPADREGNTALFQRIAEIMDTM
jgi:hypothetical protein